MSSITSGNLEQYSDSQKLAARARLHNEYTIAEVDWFPWVAKQFHGSRTHDILLVQWLWLEHVFDLEAERAGDGEGERQARVVAAVLDRIHRLARH